MFGMIERLPQPSMRERCILKCHKVWKARFYLLHQCYLLPLCDPPYKPIFIRLFDFVPFFMLFRCLKGSEKDSIVEMWNRKRENQFQHECVNNHDFMVDQKLRQ